MISSDVESGRNALGFLKELCAIGRIVKVQVDVFTALADNGIFAILEKAGSKWCPSKDDWAWLSIIAVIQSYLNTDPEPLRKYLVSQFGSDRLISRLLYIVSTKEVSVGFVPALFCFDGCISD
jgi:hypothetical protein